MFHSSSSISPPRPKLNVFSAGSRATKTDGNLCTQRVDSSHVSRPGLLLIDDDEAFLYGLRLRLERAGYDVVLASSGAVGCRIAVELKPAAVFLDLCLPGQSGEETLANLANHEATADIPVLVLTGLNEPSLGERVLQAGAREMHTKPLNQKKLSRFLSSIS